jgi:O-succinylbenzoate synthase
MSDLMGEVMNPNDVLPTLEELRGNAHPFRVALTTRFRGVTHREGLLLRGPSGWAEFAPFDDYNATATSRWLLAAIEQGWGRWPAAVRDFVPVNAIIPAVEADVSAQMTIDAIARGCTTVKVKVGGAESSQSADVARLIAVRSALSAAGVTDAQIRIDVNTGWSVDDAKNFLPMLVDAAGGLEYVEQPCATLEECAAVRSLGIAPIAIDEGIRLARDLRDEVTLAQIRAAADVVILKPIPLGGVSELLRLATALDRPAVVSGSMDTSVGLAAGVAAAAALPELSHACGLGTGALLAEDVCASTTLPVGGRIAVSRIDADAQLVEQHAIGVDNPRRAFWFARLTQAATVLGIRR